MEDGPRDSDFLPPEAPGPEPDLGQPGQSHQPHQDTTQQLPQPQPTQPYGQPPPPQGWPPPQQGAGQQQAWGHQQPGAGEQQAGGQQQGWGQPPGYGYGQSHGPPPGWQGQPPGGWQQPGWQGHQQQAWPGQQPWQPHAAWATGPKEPDNTPAVAGFSLSLIGGGLLFFFAGLSTIVSLGLAIAGIIYSRKGRAMVDEGKTSKQRGLAQAGFIIGIVSTVLSVLATVFWILFFVLLATNDDFRRDLENSNGSTISMDLSIGLLRGLFSLLS